MRMSKSSPPRKVSAYRRLHLEDAIANFEDEQYIQRVATEVINRDRAGFLLVEAIGERRAWRFVLVDDAEHVEAGVSPPIWVAWRCAVVEIRGNGDDGLRLRSRRYSSVRGFLHLLKDVVGVFAMDSEYSRRRSTQALLLSWPSRSCRGRSSLLLLDHRVVPALSNEARSTAKNVRLPGLATAWRLAAVAGRPGPCPSSASRVMIDGVVCVPSAFSMTLAVSAFDHGDVGNRRAEIDPNDLSHGPHILLVAAGWLGPGRRT